ncbi:MAG TPA: hypothetical protein VND67_06990 [Acidimicrobiales bacterium]|nr:hypothetical protein [Acidimicrobiales bacterium]
MPKTATKGAPLRVTKRVGHPGWMGRPVHRRLRIRRSTALMVVLFVGFELLHIQYPSTTRVTITVPNGYVPSITPVTSTTTTTTTPPSTTTTTPPVASSTTTTVTPGVKASSTTTSTTGVGGATTSTTGVGGATTSTTAPGAQGTSTTTTSTTIP